MGKLRTITRRTFFVAGAAVAGGVTFGVWQAKRDLPNPNENTATGISPNPYLIIDQSGVTIIAPRAEMGQGVHTTLAAMVAEELDVAWETINVVHGAPAQTYYNGALMGLVLPFPTYSETKFQGALKDALSVIPKVMGLQLTGVSTSTIDGFEKMRLAGCAAREAMKGIASARLGIDTEFLLTEDGKVIGPQGETLSYFELVEDAALTGNLETLTLRDPSDWKYLGKDMPRVDMVGKSTGTATFGADIVIEGMKFAAIRMNPKLGGAMLSYDDTLAKDMAGVEAVVSLKGGLAVVATNTWLAQQAVDAVDIEWGDAPYPPNTEGLQTKIREAFDTRPNSVLRDDGDVSGAIGERNIEAEYTAPWLAHATMETMNATALFSGQSLDMWVGTQAPTIFRDKVAKAVGIDSDAVNIVTPYLGGGFGRRIEYDVAVQAAMIAKAMPDVPVKLTWSHEEDMRHDFYRPAAIARFKGAISDGKILTLSGAIAGSSITRQISRRVAGITPPGPDIGHVEGAYDQPYGIPNFRIAGHLADIELPVGYWRSVGNSLNGFFLESFIDELAHSAGTDPLETRLELVRKEHEPTAKLFEKVREMSGWTGTTPDGIGRGIAMTYSFGTPVVQVVEVADTKDGIRLNKVWIACDVGTALDPRNIKAQMSGGAIFGLSAAMFGEITFADGMVEQENFPDYELLRMHTTPEVEVSISENNTEMGGVGEPGTPPAAAALANALFDLTGIRARDLPLSKTFDFAT
jgi:isoquinoline 1-oxidoreductase beta subunit